YFLRTVPMFLDFSIFDAEDIERIVVILVRRIARIRVFVFEDEPNEISLRARDDRHLIWGHRFGNRVYGLPALLGKVFDKPGAAGIRIGIVLNVGLRLIFRREFEMPGIQ